MKSNIDEFITYVSPKSIDFYKQMLIEALVFRVQYLHKNANYQLSNIYLCGKWCRKFTGYQENSVKKDKCCNTNKKQTKSHNRRIKEDELFSQLQNSEKVVSIIVYNE